MGFRICYLSSRAQLEDLVRDLGLSIAGSAEAMPDGQWWVARLSDSDWTVLWSEDEGFGEQRRTEIVAHSQGHDIMLCEVNETAMYSSARCWSNGELVWEVTHRGDAGDVYDLSMQGDPPDSLAAIRDGAEAKQAAAKDVDYIFEVPLDLAAYATGFRHDRWLERDAVDQFHLVAPPKAPSLWGRLFGHDA